MSVDITFADLQTLCNVERDEDGAKGLLVFYCLVKNVILFEVTGSSRR
jgi:hypothetical protein